MHYIDQIFSDTLEIKQSKFISHIVPFGAFEQTLQNLKVFHPKARHFVTAYRYLNGYSQIVEHSNDDGEPKGTSGKPTLMVLQGENIINTAVITVRYFGGTKLGTGGLVRAYSDAVHLVLKNAVIQEYKYEIVKTIEFDYKDLRKIEYECAKNNIVILEKEFFSKTRFIIRSDEIAIKLFLNNLERVIQVF